MSKIQSESKSQLPCQNRIQRKRCKPICQRYNLKANHNYQLEHKIPILAVNQYVKDTI